jgi:RimJ/RimL family protein N-acetyltransferase
MADAGGPVSPARPVWLGVVSLCLVQFADVLGVTVTVTALPAMLSDLQASPDAASLISAGLRHVLRAGRAPPGTDRARACLAQGDHLGMAELRFPVPPLADEVVLLRPWHEADVPGKLLAFSDPVMQRFSWRTTPYTEADARSAFAGQEQARLRGEELNFALARPCDHAAVLGGCSLYDVRLDQGCAALGYWLASEARGRGVATHAVRLLARWAFAELGLARLELTCGPDNEASQRVAGRCGFVREGLLRSHVPFQGGRRDSMIYSLLPGELR